MIYSRKVTWLCSFIRKFFVGLNTNQQCLITFASYNLSRKLTSPYSDLHDTVSMRKIYIRNYGCSERRRRRQNCSRPSGMFQKLFEEIYMLLCSSQIHSIWSNKRTPHHIFLWDTGKVELESEFFIFNTVVYRSSFYLLREHMVKTMEKLKELAIDLEFKEYRTLPHLLEK